MRSRTETPPRDAFTALARRRGRAGHPPVSYPLLRLLHFIGVIAWLGAGLSVPFVAALRRTLAAGLEGGPALMARLRLTTFVVVPSAVLALGSGLALASLRGGLGALPPRYSWALGLALAVFAVGGGFTSPAMKRLGAALSRGDRPDAERCAALIVLGLRMEDALRLSVLVLMVLPIEA
jgi:hypothetical protein